MKDNKTFKIILIAILFIFSISMVVLQVHTQKTTEHKSIMNIFDAEESE